MHARILPLLFLLAGVMLGGCIDAEPAASIDSPVEHVDDEGIVWTLANEVQYRVSGSEGSSIRVEASLTDASDEFLEFSFRRVDGGAGQSVLMHRGTGQVETIHYLEDNVTVWPIQSARHIPMPVQDFKIESVDQFQQVIPLGLQWILFLEEDTGTFGDIHYTRTITEDKWSLGGYGPCMEACWLINGIPQKHIAFQYNGTVGQLYPDSASHWYKEARDAGTSTNGTITLAQRMTQSEDGIVLDAIREPIMDPLLPDDIACEEWMCERGDEPPSKSFVELRNNVEDSLDFQRWSAEQDEIWDPFMLYLFGRDDIRLNSQPAAKSPLLQSSTWYLESDTAETQIFGGTEAQPLDGLDVSVNLITGQGSLPASSPEFFPHSPWVDIPMQPLGNYYDQYVADGGSMNAETTVVLIAHNPINAPQPAYRVVLVIESEDDYGNDIQHWYSIATGKLLARAELQR